MIVEGLTMIRLGFLLCVVQQERDNICTICSMSALGNILQGIVPNPLNLPLDFNNRYRNTTWLNRLS